MKNNVVMLYMPVIHRGYVDFLRQFATKLPVFLLGDELTQQFRPLVKDVRALAAEEMAALISGKWGIGQVSVLTESNVSLLVDTHVISPSDEVMRQIFAKYLPQTKVTWHSVFLRWDSQKSTAQQPVQPDFEISQEKFDQVVMKQAEAESQHSADWWRQVGAVMVKDGQVVLSGHNRHVPDEQQPYFDGDPRADFKKRIHIELSTALHAEAGLIAEAAKRGLALDGASMYVTTFPCPVCAKSIAASGIKKVYFRDGYAMLDGQQILEDFGVEIILVKT